jgi:hypothetical protein
MNHALPIPPGIQPDVGTRTDILYHNVWKSRGKSLPWEELVPILRESVRWVCATRPYTDAEGGNVHEIDSFLAILDGQLPFRTISPRAFIRLKWGMRCHPNAGIITIQDLLQFDIRELYITGFTFYKGGKAYYDGYRGVGLVSWLHPADRHVARLREWVKVEPRIRLDDALERILGS